MIFSLILPMSSFMPIFIAIIHFQPPYNANKYILVSGALRTQLLCCAHAIPKPTMPFCRQHPNTPSCRFSLQSFTSSQNNLRISAFWRASCAITCAARIQIEACLFNPTFYRRSHSKGPKERVQCASNKNKTFHRKACCATHRLLSHLFNLYAWLFSGLI